MKLGNLLSGMLLLLLATLSWGGMFPVAKSLLAQMDAFTLTAIRYGITSLILLAILVRAEGRHALRLDGRGIRAFVFGSLGFAGFSLFAFVGLSRSLPEHGAIIMALMPLITAVVNWAHRRQRPGAFTLAAVVAAFAGVLLVVTQGNIELLLTDRFVSGDLLIFLGAVSWVIYTLGAAGFPDWSPLRYTALTCALGVLTIFAATLLAAWLGYTRIPPPEATATVFAELGYIIVFASVLAVLSWNTGIRTVGALNGVLFINLVPVTAFAIGLVQGHRFGHVELAGAALTLTALIANNLYLRRWSKR